MLYTVKPGDTLSKLAARFYGDFTRWHEIAAANRLPDPDLITIGQELYIPGLINTSTPSTMPDPLWQPPRTSSGELRVEITRGAQPAAQAAAWSWLTNPWIIGALAAGMLLLSPRQRRPARRRRNRK